MTTYADPGAVAALTAHVSRVEVNWANAIRARMIHHFLDAAARDAAYASPTEGLAAYITGLDEMQIYNGVAWKPPWNLAWGLVAKNTPPTSDQGAITTIADVTGVTCGFTVVASRIYEVTVKVEASNSTAASGCLITVADSGNVIKKQSRFHFPTAATSDTCSFSYFETGLAAGAITRKVRATASSGGTVTINNAGSGFEGQIYVKDIGPSTAPA